MNRQIRTMVTALRNHSHGIPANDGVINACCGNAADMLVALDARLNTAIMALRGMIDGGDEMRGYDSQLTSIIELLEKPL